MFYEEYIQFTFLALVPVGVPTEHEVQLTFLALVGMPTEPVVELLLVAVQAGAGPGQGVHLIPLRLHNKLENIEQ